MLIDFPLNFKKIGNDLDILSDQYAVLQAIKNIITLDRVPMSDKLVKTDQYQLNLKIPYNGMLFIRKVKEKIEELKQVSSASVSMNHQRADDLTIKVTLNNNTMFDTTIKL